MRHHIAKKRPVGVEFLIVAAAHLADHGAFAMHHFIVGNGQHVIFGKTVEEREGQLIVVAGAEQRIHGHIAEHIVHPAHIPFKVKPQTSVAGGLGDHGPGGGFLGDHQRIRELFKHRFIQMPQKINCL